MREIPWMWQMTWLEGIGCWSEPLAKIDENEGVGPHYLDEHRRVCSLIDTNRFQSNHPTIWMTFYATVLETENIPLSVNGSHSIITLGMNELDWMHTKTIPPLLYKCPWWLFVFGVITFFFAVSFPFILCRLICVLPVSLIHVLKITQKSLTHSKLPE